MATCFDVAEYFLWRQEENGGLMTNMKLQKLCYYAQGFTLAITGLPLFSERIEAWLHGPVVFDLYQKYKENGIEPIKFTTDGKDFKDIASKFTQTQLDILDEVWDVFGCYEAWKLRAMTHEEAPWIDAFRETDTLHCKQITNEAMRRYFVTRLA